MPPDATETKRRLKKAAVEEFARHGLAGARVDRIAENAAANKRSIYMHFGTKEELFDMVVADSMVELAQAVSIDASDLAEYAGELFDQLEQRPHVRRLYLWAGLERQQPVDAEVAEYRRNIAAIEAAQAAGRVRTDIPATELMAMTVALVMSWETASWSLKALQTQTGPASFAPRRRDAIAAAVTALVHPPRTRSWTPSSTSNSR
ncbi:TetR/AcrR family transcriptional regulator [Streptomyces minutiscleroticus]|uniref:TetR family regulatory protein n=1 Tax=Streptomyces minutiscleroticus TaxID=68238 RepID=A0A918KQN6_9ACTN|nr:TetR family transcriptional regulator [Streptomyces minutiscleroticus]GGX69745.1 putative TetR family regulatory protein [Streptomyces minutiscleroticus]